MAITVLAIASATLSRCAALLISKRSGDLDKMQAENQVCQQADRGMRSCVHPCLCDILLPR